MVELIMIQMQTIVDIADNSGAKSGRCIKVLGGSSRRTASIGDVIVIAIQKASPLSAVKRKAVVKAVIVRTKQPIKRADGSHVRFDKNAAVVIDGDNNPRGTRIFGAIPRELRDRKFLKIISLAIEVV